MPSSAPSKVKHIAALLEELAPLRYQESYDNAGLQVGDPEADVTGVLLCTDITPAVVDEAIGRGMNLVVSHHPLIFHGLKKIAGRDYVERLVAQAIKHDINLYSAHTNIDNAAGGVSWHMAERLGLTDVETLDPQAGQDTVGCGVVGNIAPMPASEFLLLLKRTFTVGAVRYAGTDNATVARVALCGGAGAFLIDRAMEARADIYVTADVKYHDFMRSYEGIIIADIGHYESEQFTKEIFKRIIQKKNPTFAVEFARKEENQIKYI